MFIRYLVKHVIVILALLGIGCLQAKETHKDLLMQAEALRENGETLQALDLYNTILIQSQQNHQYEGVLDALTGRLIAWQHLFNREEDKVYAILARKEAEAMLSIAQTYHIQDKDYLIHFLLGKSCIFLKDFKAAEEEFKQAVELYPNDNAEKGDWIAHLGEAIYRNGQKEKGKTVIIEGVEHMQAHASEVDSFRIHVWLSGAYLRLAKILILDNKLTEAQHYLQKGKLIVEQDPRLVIRQQQLEMLMKKIEEKERQ